MATSSCIGIGNIAKKIKGGAVGINNTSHKLKKGWIGVDNIARLIFSSVQELVYVGKITPLSVARYDLSSTTVGNYALFGGGYRISNVVDAYTVS